ncbi:MAG TPA: ChbG/HpnK family deacetylase [Gammaproteobacteria bacterium]|nr:ChbG/HpnK family deacetylase [Gammaproteobacteria bacterium]
MLERRRVILCADDFALGADVSEGILHLASAGRLSAVSCLTDAPAWPSAGAELRRHRAHVSLGLHFSLTESFGFGERRLGAWIAASLARAVDRRAVRAHLLRQIDAFRIVVGAPPSFIDGHHHVHAFPVIREIVADVAAEVGGARPIPLRDVRRFFGPTDAPLKRYVIGTLARAGRPAGAPLNAAMSGDYSLSASADFARLFAGWLAAAPDGGLIMCHPAAAGAGEQPTAGSRELAFLESDALPDLLDRHGLELARPERSL